MNKVFTEVQRIRYLLDDRRPSFPTDEDMMKLSGLLDETEFNMLAVSLQYSHDRYLVECDFRDAGEQFQSCMFEIISLLDHAPITVHFRKYLSQYCCLLVCMQRPSQTLFELLRINGANPNGVFDPDLSEDYEQDAYWSYASEFFGINCKLLQIEYYPNRDEIYNSLRMADLALDSLIHFRHYQLSEIKTISPELTATIFESLIFLKDWTKAILSTYDPLNSDLISMRRNLEEIIEILKPFWSAS